MAIFTTLSVVIWFFTDTLGIFATLVYVFTTRLVIYDILSMKIIPTLSTSILFCNLANFATLIHTKKKYTVWQFLPYYMVITTLHTGSLS